MPDYVAFSGGKDSTALALLMPDATPVFTDTGDEFSELYAHIDKFERVTGRKVERIMSKEGTLPEYIQRQKFMPGHQARFCTRIFKIDAYNDWLKAQGRLPAVMCIGLRADEEERIGNLTAIDGLTVRYPLREMGLGIYDVIRICADADLLPRALPYMARGGCKGCFYKRVAEVRAMHYMMPAVLDELQAREEAVQDERGKFAYMFPNIGMSIAAFRERECAQGTLFDMRDAYADAAQRDDVGAACGLFCNR